MKLSVRELVEFVCRQGDLDNRRRDPDRLADGSRIHRRLQKQEGEGYQAEVPLSLDTEYDGILYTVEGRADGVLTTKDGVLIDEIKTISAPIEETGEGEKVHWAQAFCYAYMYGTLNGLDRLQVRLTYYQRETGEIRRLQREYSIDWLETFFMDLLFQYQMWARMELDWTEIRDRSIRELVFPYPSYRKGQRQLAVAVYRTVQEGKRLFCQAPTGIGKTMSTLFPAVKAMGEGLTEKIFYLTAKTITRQVAEDACRRMGAAGLRLRSVTLTAKDKICPLKDENGKRTAECNPDSCPLARGHFDRVNGALYELLNTGDCIDRETVENCASRHRVCPFELQLDATLWCDCIIGDYNYVFDPQVYLRRFFESRRGDYLFLVDEAHNLVDRARDMYSASLSKTACWKVKKALADRSNLSKALTALNKAFLALGMKDGVDRMRTQPEPADEVRRAAEKAEEECALWLRKHPGSPLEDEVLSLYFELLSYLRIAELYDERYVTMIRQEKQEIEVRQFCIDPSALLASCMDKGRAAVLFSATLTPLPYFSAILGGGEESTTLMLDSPFDPANLCLLVADGVSTRYKDRDRSLEQVTELIAEVVRSKRGNYMVFFPSYSYMHRVQELFCQRYKEISVIVQQTQMNEEQRAAFLSAFQAGSGEALVGFCVLGGLYSEGIDLEGDRLIGSIIVGVGLPQINPEQEVVRTYFDRQNQMGFAYAYQFPGMNKVLQAAGRVIRSEKDRGMVVLIDDRFTTTAYRRLFPRHWNRYQVIRSTNALHHRAESFWLLHDG